MCVNLWQKKIYRNLKQLAKKQKSKTGLGADVLKKKWDHWMCKNNVYKKGVVGFCGGKKFVK